MAKNLCKKCKDCKFYVYSREYHNQIFKFLYCNGNKYMVDKFNWIPETHVKGHTSYVRCSNPKKFGYNRLHTYWSEEGYILDHKNKKGLDNRMCNWRLLSARENMLNRTDNKKYPGAYREGDHYVAKIKYKGKYHRIGTAKTAKEASEKYKERKRIINLYG